MNKIKYLVAIPIYRWPLNKSEVLSILKTISLLYKYDICWIGPEKLKNKIPKIISNKNIKFISFPDEFFNSIKGYNKLLKSVFFYKKLASYDYLLITQTDSLVIRDDLEKWGSCGYGYIGAPWYKGMSIPKSDYKLIGVGNGGFSLRNVNDCCKILENCKPNILSILKIIIIDGKILQSITTFFKLGIIPGTFINEDIFWGVIAPILSDKFRVPTPQKALKFAFEVAPEDMYLKAGQCLPFGCHAWEKYNKAFWVSTLGLNYFKVNNIDMDFY